MVVTETEFLLVNPDRAKLGWGVVHFIAFLQVTPLPPPSLLHSQLCIMYFIFVQDVDVTSDPADNCSLYVVCSRDSTRKRPALSAKFQFDDYIRCVSARQLLLRSKDNLRLAKMTRITKMLHLPVPEASPTLSTATASVAALRPQTDTHHNMGVISLSPTPRGALNPSPLPPTTAQADLTSSVLTKAFLPPAATPLNTQEFEMSNFQLHHHASQLHSLAEADAPAIFDSSVKLAPPIEDYSSEESSSQSFRESLDSSLTNVHIGTDSLLVTYDNSSKSRTPETLLEQSMESHNTELEERLSQSDLSSSSEQLVTPAEGYKVEQLGGGGRGVASLFDPAAAEEDKDTDTQPNIVIQETAESAQDGVSSEHVLLDARELKLTSDSLHSQLLMSVEQGTDPLADEEDDPRLLAANKNTWLNNGDISSHFPSTGYTEGGAPRNKHQLLPSTGGAVVPDAIHQLPMSSNIIWDVPLIEEIKHKGEDSSRTGPTDPAIENHARIT